MKTPIIYLITFGILLSLPLETSFAKTQKTEKTQENEFADPELPSWDDQTNPETIKKTQGPPITPPFGLKWGESPEIIRGWSEKKEYKRKKYQKGENLILEVQGPFENLEFQTIRFHFKSNELKEIELQYPPRKTESEGLFQLAQIKEEIEKQRGEGILQPQKEGQQKSDFWRINRYCWSDGKNFLWLVNFQMKENPGTNNTKTVSISSLHYRQPSNK